MSFQHLGALSLLIICFCGIFFLPQFATMLTSVDVNVGATFVKSKWSFLSSVLRIHSHQYTHHVIPKVFQCRLSHTIYCFRSSNCLICQLFKCPCNSHERTRSEEWTWTNGLNRSGWRVEGGGGLKFTLPTAGWRIDRWLVVPFNLESFPWLLFFSFCITNN